MALIINRTDANQARSAGRVPQQGFQDRELEDGSYLSVICPDAKSRKSRAGEITLRVIDYSLPGVPGAQERYRLIPTLPDPKKAPALELAALYHERREVKGVLTNSRPTSRSVAAHCAARPPMGYAKRSMDGFRFWRKR